MAAVCFLGQKMKILEEMASAKCGDNTQLKGSQILVEGWRRDPELLQMLEQTK